jgi:putative transposase
VPDDLRRELPDDVVDELLAGARAEEEIVGPGGLLSQLTKRLVERALEVELTDHLGYEPHREPPGGAGNTRNGNSAPKRLQTEHGPVEIRTPRDRDGSFEPQLVRKRQRRFEGFDEKILALYSRGMSTRDIEAHLRELYGVSVGRDLISRVTDAVMDDVREWQSRPLEDVYPVLFLDCMMVKIRDGSVQRRACYLALAIRMDGERDVLGMWFQESEGAKFWMQVLTELKDRGVSDILICCVDGLAGFPEAIEAVFPKTVVQTCIVHLIRTSLRYVPRRDYDAVTKDLRAIYTAIDADRALHALDAFEAKWGQKLPPVVKAWRDAWEYVIPFLAFPPEVRRVIYTTNAIEALNRQLRKAVKTKGHFPTEDSARKLIYLAIHNAVPQWTRTRGWTKALLAFKIHFGDRLPD